MSNLKVLVCGDVQGKFDQFLTRIKKVHSKNGPFQMVLCVGSFFAKSIDAKKQWDDFVAQKPEVPLPVYILGPNSPLEIAAFPGDSTNGCELYGDITYLGQKGVLTTSEGLQIAYLSGAESRSGQTGPHTYRQEDVDSLVARSLVKDFAGVDVLLTSDWPRNIEQFAPAPPPSPWNGCASVARLARSLKPRYHFAGSCNVFYERAPYRNHQVLVGSQCHVTRFLGLGRVGNPDPKNRWIYAFQIVPMSRLSKVELHKQPDVTTECPYLQEQAGLKPAAEEPTLQYFFDPRSLERGRGGAAARGNRGRGRGGRGGQFGHQPERRPGGDLPGQPPRKRPVDDRGPDCWFCLGSPKVEKHLVITVANQTYLALAKGPLVDDHFLVLPIHHHADSQHLPPDVLGEVEAYKQAIVAYFKGRGKTCVFFERNFRSRHLQLQAIPLRHDASEVERVFVAQGKARGITLKPVDKGETLDGHLGDSDQFFLLELANGRRLFHSIRQGGHFPLQFAREVLASSDLLDLPRRVHWKDVEMTAAEETDLAGKVRRQFAPFDITLDDDEDD